MPRTFVRVLWIAAFLALGTRAAEPDAGADTSLQSALERGSAWLELRPRFNRIDESDKEERATGITYRAMAGWSSAPWQSLRLTAELIHADNIGKKEYNDNGALFATSEYPLLPDPRYSGVNRLFVEYDGLEATHIAAGRQRVRMDNQRFVSDNDFRQTPQLFDGVMVTNRAIANTSLFLGYFNRVRTTSGDVNRLRLTLLNAAWNPAPGHAVAAYAYFHDQPQNGAFTGFADNSYRLAGARAEGAFALCDGLEAPYLIEWARQDAYSGGDARIDARYWRIGGGLSSGRWTLRYDEEAKGSNAGLYGLQNPLTDYYAFNGWTLHFFNTPRQGLRDRWATGRWQWGDWVLYGEGHEFESDFGDLDFGRETDMGLTWFALEGLILRLQHARYRPGTASPPQPRVTKTWLTLTFTY